MIILLYLLIQMQRRGQFISSIAIDDFKFGTWDSTRTKVENNLRILTTRERCKETVNLCGMKHFFPLFLCNIKWHNLKAVAILFHYSHLLLSLFLYTFGQGLIIHLISSDPLHALLSFSILTKRLTDKFNGLAL